MDPVPTGTPPESEAPARGARGGETTPSFERDGATAGQRGQSGGGLPPPDVGTRLEPRERALGYGGALLAALAFAALWVPHLGSAVPKGQPAPSTDLAFGLGLAAMLALATLSGRRYVLGFASLVVELGPWGRQPLLALPFVAFGAWLVVRASRDSRRRAEARRRTGRPGEAAGASRAGAKALGTSAPRARHRSAGAAEAPAGRPRPAPSKRYTPPKPRRRGTRGPAVDGPAGPGRAR
jgi:hypothetical protein